jgi:hypothetical protein
MFGLILVLFFPLLSSSQIMACPSGCLNGGGQIKPAGSQTPAQLLEELEHAYNSQVGGGMHAAGLKLKTNPAFE